MVDSYNIYNIYSNNLKLIYDDENDHNLAMEV